MTTMRSDPIAADPAGRARRHPALAAAGVTVRRGDRPLLDDANVSVEHGQVMAIAGGSGAGKTTLLRASPAR